MLLNKSGGSYLGRIWNFSFWQDFVVTPFQEAREYVIIQSLLKSSWQNGAILISVMPLIIFVGMSVAWKAFVTQGFYFIQDIVKRYLVKSEPYL